MREDVERGEVPKRNAYSYSSNSDHSLLAALGLSLTPSPASHHIIHRVHNGHHDPVGSPVHLGIQPNRTVSTPYRPALAVPEQSAVIPLRLCCSMTRVQVFTTLGLQPDTARPAYFRVHMRPTGAHGGANTKGQGKSCSGEKLGRKPRLENSRAE